MSEGDGRGLPGERVPRYVLRPREATGSTRMNGAFYRAWGEAEAWRRSWDIAPAPKRAARLTPAPHLRAVHPPWAERLTPAPHLRAAAAAAADPARFVPDEWASDIGGDAAAPAPAAVMPAGAPSVNIVVGVDGTISITQNR